MKDKTKRKTKREKKEKKKRKKRKKRKEARILVSVGGTRDTSMALFDAQKKAEQSSERKKYLRSEKKRTMPIIDGGVRRIVVSAVGGE